MTIEFQDKSTGTTVKSVAASENAYSQRLPVH